MLFRKMKLKMHLKEENKFFLNSSQEYLSIVKIFYCNFDQKEKHGVQFLYNSDISARHAFLFDRDCNKIFLRWINSWEEFKKNLFSSF